MATSWVSYRQPLGNSGRSGRSIMRAVSVPFSPARPSRLKNEPGIFPAAYMRSSTSTVSGRKSTSRGLPAVAVQRTIVSPLRTTTAPEACLAIRPVSIEISVPAISAETRVTSAMRILSCPSIGPDGPKRAYFVASVGSPIILEDRAMTDRDFSTVQAIIDAFDRRDIEAMLDLNHPDGEWINPDYAIEPGVRR